MSFIRDGHLIHTNDRRRVRLRDFSFSRLLLIVSIVAVLFATNPANQQNINIKNLINIGKGSSGQIGKNGNRKRTKDEYTTRIASEWLGIEINIKSPNLEWLSSAFTTSLISSSSSKTRYSNYLLFSLSKHYKGVDLHVLLLQLPLCTYEKHGIICEWVVDKFCQDMKMWDPSHRPFTVIRLIQIMKLISYALQSCYMTRGRSGRSNLNMSESMILCPQAGSSIASSFFSIIYQPLWYSDFVPIHLFLYPTLSLLDRITLAGTSTQSQASFEFYASALGLLCIVATLSNHIAFLCTNENHIRGMKGSLASVLGYCCAAKPNLILLELRYFGVQLTSGDLWFHTFALSAILNLLGLRSNFAAFSLFGPGHWRTSDCVAWGVGGMMGYCLCRMQLEQYNLWWWSF